MRTRQSCVLVRRSTQFRLLCKVPNDVLVLGCYLPFSDRYSRHMKSICNEASHCDSRNVFYLFFSLHRLVSLPRSTQKLWVPALYWSLYYSSSRLMAAPLLEAWTVPSWMSRPSRSTWTSQFPALASTSKAISIWSRTSNCHSRLPPCPRPPRQSRTASTISRADLLPWPVMWGLTKTRSWPRSSKSWARRRICNLQFWMKSSLHS